MTLACKSIHPHSSSAQTSSDSVEFKRETEVKSPPAVACFPEHSWRWTFKHQKKRKKLSDLCPPIDNCHLELIKKETVFLVRQELFDEDPNKLVGDLWAEILYHK